MRTSIVDRLDGGARSGRLCHHRPRAPYSRFDELVCDQTDPDVAWVRGSHVALVERDADLTKIEDDRPCGGERMVSRAGRLIVCTRIRRPSWRDAKHLLVALRSDQ